MLTTGGQRPKNMGAFAALVYDVLQNYTVSPWNVLKVECGWRGVDPLMMEQNHLAALIEPLGAHVARMTDADNAVEMKAQLRLLLTR